MQRPPALPEEKESRDIYAAREALDIEIKALEKLASHLDENFSHALNTISGIDGRLIVTGIGKSGHVGRKIAATFASTGTPAFFVHPSEASHGDLGMLTEKDAVLAISNSGEAPELADILAYCKRFNIPLIGITSRPDSSLNKQADVTIFLPPHDEACPNGLAPTTSTTLTIALGDAMAIALMKRRQFTSSDYRNIHPGGKLGKRLLKVSGLMHSGDALPLVSKDALMRDVLITMTQKGFGCAVVTDENDNVTGLISDGDLRRHMSENFVNQTAGEVMTPGPKTIESEKLAAEALRIMNEKAITFLIVTNSDDGKMAGIVRMHDILRAGVA